MGAITVNDENFRTILNEKQKVIVKYNSGWCDICRSFQMKYDKLATDDRFQEITFLEIIDNKGYKVGENSLPFFATYESGRIRSHISTDAEPEVVKILQDLQN
ncbi:MAG: thioredoxin family protein [Bacteroidota bacterium]